MTTMSSFIPDSAPFSEEQRAWLNGFFSGLMGIQPGMSPQAALEAAGIRTEAISGGIAEEEEDDFPWHDSALPIVDRMELAEGRTLEHRLMAAMAQLDCGSCGYQCQTYSEAIASGAETNLTLCSPGGKETKQMLKSLLKEEDAASTSKPASSASIAESSDWSRQKPFPAKLIECRPLNKGGSKKDTRHVAIDLQGSGLTYNVGDSLGVYPTNCPDLATTVVRKIVADDDLTVDTPLGSRKPLLEALIEDCCLRDPSDELIELLLTRSTTSEARHRLSRLVEESAAAGFDVLDLLEMAGDAPMTATEFIESLDPLNPRLYSIASSMNHVGPEVHLVVGKVTYEREGRERKGVASTMLADRVGHGETLRVFVQPNHDSFTIPQRSDAPMIMVAAGTGIAPFVAFLQERDHANASGDNWLFFGDQHADTDFLYQETLFNYVGQGLLTRLDTAFSRDGKDKVYVQDRMRAHGEELWHWIQQGAHFFVCGDASRMANDVHRTLVDIVSQHGKMPVPEAEHFVDQMKSDKRYVRDVY